MIDRKPNLGIDLDGVVCNFWGSFRAEIFKKTGVVVPENVSKYNIEECTTITRKQIKDILGEGLTMYRNFTEIPGSKKSLHFLKNLYTIYIITCRNFYKGIRKDTKEWLINHDIPFDKIIFTGLDKTQQVLKTSCEYMIEDKGETAIKLARKGQKIILFDCLYNRDFKHRLIVRVKNWQEIVKILTGGMSGIKKS